MKILRKILSALLILLIVVITTQNTIAYIYFKVNQNYIAKNLCVKKDIKDNYCLGNCYLKAIQKKLTEDNEKQNDGTVPVKYNSSNPIHEFIFFNSYNVCKVEFVIFFNRDKHFETLTEVYTPVTPPPEFANIV